jgi:hypothetical protein
MKIFRRIENWKLNEGTRVYSGRGDCVAGTEMNGLANCHEAETGVRATQGDVESGVLNESKTSC